MNHWGFTYMGSPETNGFSVQVAHAAVVDAAASREDDRAAKDPHNAVAEAAAPRDGLEGAKAKAASGYVRAVRVDNYCSAWVCQREVGYGDGEARAQQLWLVRTRVG